LSFSVQATASIKVHHPFLRTFMIKMKNTTLIITALLALNVSHNTNSEPEKPTPTPAAETAPANTPAPAVANPNYSKSMGSTNEFGLD
jgi:hypothetical protein